MTLSYSHQNRPKIIACLFFTQLSALSPRQSSTKSVPYRRAPQASAAAARRACNAAVRTPPDRCRAVPRRARGLVDTPGAPQPPPPSDRCFCAQCAPAPHRARRVTRACCLRVRYRRCLALAGHHPHVQGRVVSCITVEMQILYAFGIKSFSS